MPNISKKKKRTPKRASNLNAHNNSMIDNQTSVLSNVLNTILQAIYKLDEGLGDKLYDAMSGLQFRINEREFARLVKEV